MIALDRIQASNIHASSMLHQLTYCTNGIASNVNCNDCVSGSSLEAARQAKFDVLLITMIVRSLKNSSKVFRKSRNKRTTV